MQQCKIKVAELVEEITRISQDADGDGAGGEKEKYIIPPHLHDLTEADLPETQRGLVISEIQQFRERSAKREKEKERANQQQMMMQNGNFGHGPAVPNGPKAREWGKPHGSGGGQQQYQQHGHQQEPYQQQGFGRGAQGYNKPVGFVKENGHGGQPQQQASVLRTDEELEGDRKESRRQDEEMSFRDVCISSKLSMHI